MRVVVGSGVESGVEVGLFGEHLGDGHCVSEALEPGGALSWFGFGFGFGFGLARRWRFGLARRWRRGERAPPAPPCSEETPAFLASRRHRHATWWGLG